MKTFKELIFSNNGIKNKFDFKTKLLAGQWCIMDYPELHHKHKSFKIIEHPWKNSLKLLNSYNYKKQLEEKAIEQLRKQLNYVHGENLSFRSWKIILSPWLNTFLTIILERRMLINVALKDHKITSVIFGDIKDKYIFRNTSDFILSIQNKTDFQDLLTKKITEIYFPNLKIEILNRNNDKNIVNEDKIGKKFFKNFINLFFKLFLRKQKKVFHLVGKSIRSNFSTIIKFKCLPYFLVDVPKPGATLLDQDIRNSLVLNIAEKKMNFLINNLLKEFLPRSFLEDYQLYKIKAFQFFPKHPSDIYTYTGYEKDDIFKIYTAHQIEYSNYNIFQHGGAFGVLEVNNEEDLISETANTFITWGWKKTNNFHNFCYKPSGSDQLKKIKKTTCNENHEIICPLSEWSPIIFRIFNGYHGHAQLDYLDLIKYITDNLPPQISENFKLRMQPGKRGWNIARSLENYGLKNNILNRKGSFVDDLKYSKIALITTNSTTLLESLRSNLPTLLFLDPAFYPINEHAKENYYLLQKSGILYYNINECLFKLKSIYNEPQIWWKNEAVQQNINKFIKEYARIT